MQTFIMLLCAVLCVTSGQQCSVCEGTRATQPKVYAGDKDVVDPYAGAPIVTLQQTGMDTILARVPLHNPTLQLYLADVSCKFFHDDWLAGTNTIRDVKVPSNSTVYAELQWGGDFLESAKAGATCSTVWHQSF